MKRLILSFPRFLPGSFGAGDLVPPGSRPDVAPPPLDPVLGGGVRSTFVGASEEAPGYELHSPGSEPEPEPDPAVPPPLLTVVDPSSLTDTSGGGVRSSPSA